MLRGINVRFDWRSMGGNAYPPFLAVLVLVSFTAANKGEFLSVLPMLELVFPFFGAWWSIFVLHDLLSEEGNEVLFTYPVKRWQVGIVRVVVFYFLHVVLLVAMLACLSIWIGHQHVLSLFLQLASQSFFYAGLGFLAMVITQNTGWSLVVVTSYLSLQILVRGEILPALDIYLHTVYPLPVERLLPYVKKNLILGCILFVNAQYLLSTTTRYK